jgi:hypothetical protein
MAQVSVLEIDWIFGTKAEPLFTIDRLSHLLSEVNACVATGLAHDRLGR